MTDMMKKDNDISRVASGLMAVTVVALVIIGWVAAVVTSDDTGIAKLEPWWRGLSAIFLPDGPIMDCPLLSAAPCSADYFGNLGGSIRDDHGLWRRILSTFRLGRSPLAGIGSLRLDCHLEASRTPLDVRSELRVRTLVWHQTYMTSVRNVKTEKPSSAIRRENKGIKKMAFRIWGRG